MQPLFCTTKKRKEKSFLLFNLDHTNRATFFAVFCALFAVLRNGFATNFGFAVFCHFKNFGAN